MNPITKSAIKKGLFKGLVYAIMIRGFACLDGREFNLWKFLILFLAFGISVALKSAISSNGRCEKKLKSE